MANELVIADTYYNRTTAMGFGYRDFQERLVKTQTGEIAGAMRENSKREIAATIASAGLVAESVRRMETGITTAINGQTEALTGALEAGFGRVTNELGRMSAEMNMGFARTEAAIDRLSDKICARLDKIANILETPRGTAARELFNNAFTNYRKGFYEEALPDVQKAVEMLTADYLSWFLEGTIYAFGAGEFSNVIDLDKAIAAYTNAAKYVSPDAEKAKETKSLAAEIRFYLGQALYARSNELFKAGNQADSDTMLSAARDSYLRSYQYSNLMLEALYNAARCKALLGDTPGALADLESVIKEDALYCVKAEIESDFDAIRGDYHRLIEKMRVELYGEAAPVYKEITDGYNLAKKEDLTQYFEKTVQITQNVPADFNRSGITGSGVAGYGIGLINNATIPLFEQCVSDGLDKNLPYLDMRVKTSPYPALLNVLKKGAEAVFQTEANDEGGVTIVKYGGGDTQVVIPASIGGKPVTAIGERVFLKKQLTSVVIPDSVTTIGTQAFFGNQLTSVVIPGSVKTIEGGAFSHNQLTSIVIPGSVKTIGDYAFSDHWLNDLTIGNGVVTIGKSAFQGKPSNVYDNLESVVIPDSVKTIGEYAFDGHNILKISIGANVNVGEWGNAGGIKTFFASSYNKHGKSAGEYVPGDLSRGKWSRYARDTRTAEEKQRDAQRNDRSYGRWITIGFVLGLALLIGGIVLGIKDGHPFILGIIGAVAGFVVFCAFAARGLGILALALIGGSIALGIHVGHPFIVGGIGVIIGLGIWVGGAMSQSKDKA